MVAVITYDHPITSTTKMFDYELSVAQTSTDSSPVLTRPFTIISTCRRTTE